MTMKKIDEMAKAAYFADEAKKMTDVNIYIGGYKKGFVKALNMVSECLSKPNNKERVESLTNLIEEYGNEGDQDKEEEAGDGHSPAHKGI